MIIGKNPMIKIKVLSLLAVTVFFSSDSYLFAKSLETQNDLSKIRMTIDLINDHQYEEAFKILDPLKLVSDRARHRLADLFMRKDAANPYYNLGVGCQYLRMAAEGGKDAARAKMAYADMLKRSPYLQMMPEVLDKECYRLYLEAADFGYAPAQQAIGVMLSRERSPRKNCLHSYMWLTLAHKRYVSAIIKTPESIKRDRETLNARKSLIESGKLNSKEMKKALRMVSAWEKKHPDAYKVWPVADLNY